MNTCFNCGYKPTNDDRLYSAYVDDCTTGERCVSRALCFSCYDDEVGAPPEFQGGLLERSIGVTDEFERANRHILYPEFAEV